MFGYVYITTNLINGKRYIGKRSLPEFDTKYLGSGKLLKRAIKKYGKDNFKCKVIKWCETEEELNYYERYYIKEYDAQKSDMFYNISEGGDWGNVTNGMTEEEYITWKAKISPLGRHHSEETKKKMSLARIGIKYSEETIQKMRENNSGKNNPMYGTHWTEERKRTQPKIYYKPVIATLPNGERIEFESVAKYKLYFKETYNIAEYTVKKLLQENTPLNLPYRERNHYPDVYKMNGLCIEYKDKEEVI